MFYLAVRWVVSRMNDSRWTTSICIETASLYYSLGLFIIGAQFLSIGLLGEMIAAYLVRDTDTYSIAEHTPPGSARRSGTPCRRRSATTAMTGRPSRIDLPASAGAFTAC